MVFTAFLGAENYKNALFASIYGVEKGDVLNVRAKPDYRSKKVAIDFIKAIDSRDWSKVADFVSPKYGITLTDFIRFNYEDMDKRVSKRAFFDALKRNSKLVKVYQGERDDAPVEYLGVRSFLKSLLNGKNITAVDEVEDDLRGFRGVGILKGFIVLWRGKDSYSRTGAVIILKRVGSRWFVVGVAKERWTI